MLSTYRFGPPGPPLLIVHGLFGSARNWGAIAKRLGREHPVMTVDLRNHGDSPWTETHSYADLAGDLAELATAERAPLHILGHSMGGKAAMTLALTRPELVASLLVADIAPVAYGHTQMPLIEAMRRLDLSTLTSRKEADAELARDVEDASVRAFLLQSLDLKNQRWKLNLDTLARDMPGILGFPELDGQFTGPTLFLTGGESDYVTRNHRPVIKSRFPTARFAALPGAGHWLHADKPREFVETTDVWLSSVKQ